MKFAICYDFFEIKGGGEKLVLFLAKKFNAPIFTMFIDKNKFYKEYANNLKFFIPRFFTPRVNIIKQEVTSFWFNNLELKQFDIVVNSGFWSIYTSEKNHPNIWYCLTPPRIFYDLYEYTKAHLDPFKAILVSLWRKYRMPRDQYLVKNYIDRIVCISKNVAKRVNKYYNRNSEVIYPPVVTKDYKCKNYEDFFLVIQRLYPPKRTSIILEAFKHLPEKKLIICGEGPEKEKLMLQAKDCKNIKFVNYNISKKELLDLYSRCLATIYIPKDEDFGFIPVESMASGKPCIGANEGGLKETIIHGKTGFLINPTVNNLIKTIKHLTPEKAEKMKKDCIKRAKEFDISVFYKKWETYLKTIGD